uniref:C2H2-type domain-containing protein n=1 Tax=Sphaeramia orbicularis TaxID=375764 RepID=A0A673AUK0_9TELE
MLGSEFFINSTPNPNPIAAADKQLCQEEEEEEETNTEPDTTKSVSPDLHDKDTENHWDWFPCQHCERRFTSKQGLERHLHIHTLANNKAHSYKSNKSSISSGSSAGQTQREKKRPVDSTDVDRLPDSSSPLGVDTSGEDAAQPDTSGTAEGHHACKYCEKIFSTYTNKRRHERRVHEQHLHTEENQLPQEENPQITFSAASQQEMQLGGGSTPAAVLEKEGEQAEQYMLDVSSNISENLSFYIDGKIVSTSTVSSCETAEVHSGSSTLVGLDALILDPAQISQVLNTDSAVSKDISGQASAKRRTATPPLLPQIKTELESEVVVSSTSSSSLVSSLIENLLPQNTESTVVQKERTVFLSPKLKQLLEKQDGLKPALALITDGQKSCSPVTLSVLPAATGRFKRRTGSPQQNVTNNEETQAPDTGECDLSTGQAQTIQNSPVHQITSDKEETPPSVEEPAVNQVLTESWPTMAGGNSCNQQPLDLSNTVKRNEDGALADAALDLSLQKRSPEDSDPTSKVVSQTLLKGASDTCVTEKSLMDEYKHLNISEPNTSLGNLAAPLVTDFIVTSSDIMTPVEPVAEGLVYGLALPSAALTPSSTSLTPVALQPASPCTIAFASPAAHTMLPAAPSLITVLAPPPIPNPSNQPIQVLAPNISPEPLVICTENGLNSSECELTTAFTQQQIVSVPNPQAVDPTILMSSIAESVMLSASSTSVISDCPAVSESGPGPEPVVTAEPPVTKEVEAADTSFPISEVPADASAPSEKAKEEESSNDTTSEAQQQSFTKNFICNVCDKLFHSMKELGQHVGDHADEWPYKCEFCLLLFGKPSALLDHRSNLHGVGKTYVCSACTKEFVYLCNLKQHQEELHPGQQCTHTEEEKGKLRPQNYNNPSKDNTEPLGPNPPEETKAVVKKEETEVDAAAEELFTTIKIMASDGGKLKGPDVRLGINQHYPSFKPPPFPYHNRSPAGTVASATNFTTHNIPQTFSTAIRCTKCGKSFDNMPELHKHILACANASDKRRYTPKRNPIPLRHFAKSQNGVLSTTNSANGLNSPNRASQSNRSKPNHETPVKMKFKVLNKRKKKLVQRALPQRNKSVPSSNKIPPTQMDEQQEIFVCPHCSREFTMRRSRTKHMAVCPKKPKEVKKRKEGAISVTKENDGHQHRGISRADEKRQTSPHHNTRLQTSGPAKRPAILPVQTVFSSKRSKIIIKESRQPKQDTPGLNELPIVRTFNPAMRQYSRVHHGIKEIPIKITLVKPQQTEPQKDERPKIQAQDKKTGADTSSTDQSTKAKKKKLIEIENLFFKSVLAKTAAEVTQNGNRSRTSTLIYISTMKVSTKNKLKTDKNIRIKHHHYFIRY